MFDIIGKRNWFFALSLAVTIPGLIFILLGPITGGKVGLQFAIDFTGGTVWTIRFKDETVTPQAVKDVFTALRSPEGKAATSTRASAPGACVSERAQEPAPAWAGASSEL